MFYTTASINDVDVLRLMTDARRSLKELLGSTIISKVGFRDNYVIIGKQGLPSGGAIEAVSSSYKHRTNMTF